MNPPPSLRVACERVMLAVRSKNSSTTNQIEALKQLAEGPLQDPEVPIDQFVEYVLVPLFLAVPSDVVQCQAVPERVREEVLKTVRVVVERSSEQFGARADLFFPALLRALATLTDAEHDGKLAAHLKEETKVEAIKLIGTLLETQLSLGNVDDPIVFHCAALLLDASSSKERSKDLRKEALQVILTLIKGATANQLEFMFPGATSSLCESSRADFKAGHLVPQLACDALRLNVLKVLGDERFAEKGFTSSKSSKAFTSLKHAMEERTRRIEQQQQQQQSKTDAPSKDDEFSLVVFLNRLFPMMVRLFEEDAATETHSAVRTSRVKLAAAILEHCRMAIELSDEEPFSKQSSSSSYKHILLRKVIFGCADVDDSVQSESRKAFERVKVSFGDGEGGELIHTMQKLLLHCVSSLAATTTTPNGNDKRSANAFAGRDDDTISGARLGMCAFLLSELPPKRLRTVLEASQTRILWSLLSFLSPETSRILTHGRLEFARVPTKGTLDRLKYLLASFVEIAPETAVKYSRALMDGVEAAVSTRSPSKRPSSSALEYEDASDDDNDNQEGTIQLPNSYVPQAVFLATRLCSIVDMDALLAELLGLDGLWTSTVISNKRTTPQSAMWNALARIASLETISYIASLQKMQFKLSLVDSLFPVLQCLGEEHSGVKLAAESCLKTIAEACAYRSEAELLQSNVDYVVDVVIRRLPQLSMDDRRFSDIIEALVRRIPVWVPGEETSPWIQDLVHTALTGLDDRANAPQVVWSLLRIAEVVATRAGQVAGSNSVVDSSKETFEDNITDTSNSIVEVLDNGTEIIEQESMGELDSDKSHRVQPIAPKRKTAEDYEAEHDRVVEAGITEITRWLHPSTTMNSPLEDVDDGEAEDGEEELDSRGKEKKQVLDSVESILLKAAIFVADEDVLVRQQAARVATKCISLLGNECPDKARIAVHQIWPFIVEQLKEERHPAILTLLLDVLTVAASSAIGMDFFSRRFSDDAWPVLEACLDRAAPPLSVTSSASIRRHRLPTLRDLELAKRVLKCVQGLGPMLIPKAERIASVTSRFITATVHDGESKELKRLACEVWMALAEHAGDVVFLSVAVAGGKLSTDHSSKRQVHVGLGDSSVAALLWPILEAQ